MITLALIVQLQVTCWSSVKWTEPKENTVLLLLENGPGAGEAEDGASNHIYTTVIWSIELQTNKQTGNLYLIQERISTEENLTMCSPMVKSY